ncbi:uncharacterized protein LOC120332969 [Styela clava]
MKILICGFSKTGTKTLDEALRQLGYRVSDYYHSCFVLGKDWEKILEGNGNALANDLKRMYQHYDATSDLPMALYWREFLDAFPDLKLIFMDRNEEKWLESWKNQIKCDNENGVSFILKVFSPTARRYITFFEKVLRYHVDPSKKSTWLDFLSPNKQYWMVDDERILETFRNHNQDILQNAPKDRLLIFNLKDGWHPLCKFLGHDEPAVPFPHRNKRGNISEHVATTDPNFHSMYTEMYISITAVFLAVSAALLLFFR